jgi:hypothetical protein
MRELCYTEIHNAEKNDIGKIALMADGCNPLAIEQTIDECLRVCIECGIEARDENGDPRPMTLSDCDEIAHLVTA